MDVFFTKKAKQAIDVIADFVESKNTYGSGNKFALKFEQAIKQLSNLQLIMLLMQNAITIC